MPRIVLHMKVSNQVLDLPLVENAIANNLKPRKVKGFKIIQPSELQSGIDGDDFVKNLTTFFISYMAYKKPRFIK